MYQKIFLPWILFLNSKVVIIIYLYNISYVCLYMSIYTYIIYIIKMGLWVRKSWDHCLVSKRSCNLWAYHQFAIPTSAFIIALLYMFYFQHKTLVYCVFQICHALLCLSVFHSPISIFWKLFSSSCKTLLKWQHP